MRFFETVIAGAAFVAAALALEINDFPSNPQAGKTYTITYSPADNTPTTFVLRKGDSNNLGTVATLTTTATGGSFQWTVDSSLTNGNDYALQVVQGSVNNYSKQFPITGGSGASASASASASAASSASASALSSAISSAISSALSSASSAASVSAASTLTTTASGAVSSSAGSNSTISSATLSATKSGASTTAKATGTSSSTGSAPANTGAASTLGSSPLALIFGAVAAIAYLH